MKVFLLRHAESNKNIGNKFDSHNKQDNLTDFGKAQVKITCEYFVKIIQNTKSTLIVSGERNRALESAIGMSKIMNVNTSIKNDLVPINPGDLSGLSDKDAWDKYPVLMENRIKFSKDLYSGYELRFPNGDNIALYEQKIEHSLKSIINNNKDIENILIITHRSVILAAINIFGKQTGHQEFDTYKYYNTPTGCIYEIILQNEKPKSIHFHGGINDWHKTEKV